MEVKFFVFLFFFFGFMQILKKMLRHICSSLKLYMRICWHPMLRYIFSFWTMSLWSLELLQLVSWLYRIKRWYILSSLAHVCLVSCSFLVEKETWLIRFYTSFFRMVIWLRSTCRSPEKYILTISSFLIIMYKDMAYLLVLISGLCGCIQSVLKSTCPWNSIKNVDHLICPKSFISEFNTSLICSWLWLNDFSPSSSKLI